MLQSSLTDSDLLIKLKESQMEFLTFWPKFHLALKNSVKQIEGLPRHLLRLAHNKLLPLISEEPTAG